MVLLVFMQLTRDLFAIAKFLLFVAIASIKFNDFWHYINQQVLNGFHLVFPLTLLVLN